MDKPNQLPFLAAVCWQTVDVMQFAPHEMLQQYERGWQYRGVLADLTVEEAEFVQVLSDRYGSWIVVDTRLDFHQHIVAILQQLNAPFLAECGVYFGGGTLLALQYEEYRLSQDIDFLCASAAGYLRLRRAIFDHGYDALFATRDRITFPRDIQTNQHGVRFPIAIANLSIKFEIGSEGRIEFDLPVYLNDLPIACLSLVDCYAEKLLANADRWLDESVCSRDLVDLAMLRVHGDIPVVAIAKAEAAYPVLEPLKRAIANFQVKPEYRERCYQTLAVRSPQAVIDGIDQLAAQVGFAKTDRLPLEEADTQDV
jgi:Nucleotidyl transferase AbiEii toxin, Type IV TA system